MGRIYLTMLSRQSTSPGGTTSIACASAAKRVTASRINPAHPAQELVPPNSNDSNLSSPFLESDKFQESQGPDPLRDRSDRGPRQGCSAPKGSRAEGEGAPNTGQWLLGECILAPPMDSHSADERSSE